MEEIYLRAIEPEDHKISVKWWNDREITDSLGGNQFYVSAERERLNMEKAALNDKVNLKLAVCTSDKDVFIGTVNLTGIDHVNKSAEFSILIGDKSYWNKGLATKASKLMLTHGFDELKLERIMLTVLESNTNAQKLYISLGFTKEGIIRNGVFKNGEYHNSIMFSILQNEYKS
jgi:RimJ/RimL family protein N-acetyltransferase